jgi:hypothetical protein
MLNRREDECAMEWIKIEGNRIAIINQWMMKLLAGAALLFFYMTASYGETNVTLTRKLPSEFNLSHIDRIAVIPFDNDISGRISNALGNYLQQTGSFELLERSRIDELTKEYQLSVSGLVDESSAAEIGQVYGVKAFVLGSVNVFRVYNEEISKKIEWSELEKYTNSKGKKKTKLVSYEAIAPAIIRRGDLDITCKIVSVESAQILAQNSASATREKTKVNHLKAKDKYQKQLPSIGVIEQELLDETLASVVKSVAPYTESITIKLDDNCKNDNCKQAMRMMKMNMLDDAKSTLETQLQKYLSSKKERKKDKGKDKKVAAVCFNLGIIAEMQGKMEEALNYHTKAIMYRIKDPAKKQTRARGRVENYIQVWQQYENMSKN